MREKKKKKYIYIENTVAQGSRSTVGTNLTFAYARRELFETFILDKSPESKILVENK